MTRKLLLCFVVFAVTSCTGSAAFGQAIAGQANMVPGAPAIPNSLQINPVKTVSTLPACNAAAEGTWSAVSDATAPTYNGALTGSGTVHVPVYCNGSAWTSH